MKHGTQSKKFFETLSPEKKKLAMKVRQIALKSDHSVKKDIKWDNVTFVSNGNLAFIYSYDTVDYLNSGFFKSRSFRIRKDR